MKRLGYADIVSRPADLVRDQRSLPDFQVVGVAASCACIVEAKKLEAMESAGISLNTEDEIREYLAVQVGWLN